MKKYILILAILFTPFVSHAVTVSYSTCGTDTFVVPTGVTSITVKTWGAGGGGLILFV